MKGHVHVESSSFSSVEGLPENIPLDILDSEGSVVDGLLARRVPYGVDQSSAAIYEFSMWASPGGKFTFIPRDARCVNYILILFFLCFLPLVLSVSLFFLCSSATRSLSVSHFGLSFKTKIHRLIRNFKEYDLLPVIDVHVLIVLV